MIADAIVAALAVACAAALYLTHLEAPRTLWLGALHDRNGHYAYAAGIALAIRDLDPVRLLQDLYNARVWPPLHGLLLAPVLAAFGPDFRLAGVVSAAAWAATMLGAFMIARRLLADAAAGLAAGAAAALWIAASPAMRAYGVDAMLESLGAALSVFALLGYIRVRERPADMRRWAQLGLVLTLLFFEKGNYWGLVVAALAAAATTVAPRAAWSWIRGEAAKRTQRGFIRGALWHPIGLAAAIVLCAVAAITLNGPTTVVLFGSSVSLHPPENLLTVGYALVFLRIAQIWYAGRAAFAAAVPAGARRLFAWHVLPIALSFLVPKRLAAFLWFVGPTNLP
ncbi:MAG: glycosyltransferase family 39 protein, partial [Alphaproteobacteria bacterium]|nr:glycosyltransferase family 39 protein [Alphaproteobacteria bacterium]